MIKKSLNFTYVIKLLSYEEKLASGICQVNPLFFCTFLILINIFNMLIIMIKNSFTIKSTFKKKNHSCEF